MNKVRPCFYALLGLFFVLLPAYSKNTPPVVVTAAGLQVVQEAQQVQPLRVTGSHQAKAPEEDQTIDSYKIIATGEPQGNEYTQRLANIVAAESIKTGREYQSACRFAPVIAYQFRGDAETVDVLICFHCYAMLIVEHDTSGKVIHEALTTFGKPSRTELLHLAKLAFPDDTNLQALK